MLCRGKPQAILGKATATPDSGHGGVALGSLQAFSSPTQRLYPAVHLSIASCRLQRTKCLGAVARLPVGADILEARRPVTASFVSQDSR